MNKGAALGLIFGLILSFISAFIFMFFAGIVATGGRGVSTLFGESWIYLATIIPFVVGFAVLGGYLNKRPEPSNRKLWLISLLLGFLITWFSGTIGAILGETIVRGGIKTVNVEDTLIWGTIYAFILAPVAWCFARLLVAVFIGFLKKYNAAPLK